jgi:hypothetical protein
MYDRLTDVVHTYKIVAMIVVVMPIITSCNPIARGVLLGDDTVVSPSRSRNCHMIKAVIIRKKRRRRKEKRTKANSVI